MAKVETSTNKWIIVLNDGAEYYGPFDSKHEAEKYRRENLTDRRDKVRYYLLYK